MDHEVETARIASAPPPIIESVSEYAIRDWLEFVDPDGVLLTGEGPRPGVISTVRRTLDSGTPLFDFRSNDGSIRTWSFDGVEILLAPSFDALRSIDDATSGGPTPDGTSFVISDRLALEVDTTALSTSVLGVSEYVAAFQPERRSHEYVHISTRLPAGYRNDWESLSMVGIGTTVEDNAARPLTLSCRGDGAVLTSEISRETLGLRAIDSVGETRARRLREAGFRTRDSIAEAGTGELAAVSGFSTRTVERVKQSVRALTSDTVVRTSDEPLPSRDPLFLDIETDGLSPTIVWLIGLRPAEPRNEEFISFLQKDPEHPGGAIRDFARWYAANGDGRPIVAYNGNRFDFQILRDHIHEHVPDFESTWKGIDRFDPYHWAITEGNAILPGRTNKLGEVAASLGHEPTGAELTGEAVARAYRRWMDRRTTDTKPDWERFESYCQDDLEALETVYEALAESGRIVSEASPSSRVEKTTTQKELSNW
ncbi:MAG: ribonuclease H-like domain-containing protein [Halodesulfurarchaeum sp.]